MSQKRFLIVDGNALVHRAFHAIPPLTKNGVVLNAVYGFASILFKGLKEIKPDFLAITFDLAAPTFRHEEYKEYKAKRVKQPQELYDQLPLVKDLLRAMGVAIFEQKGFEADDVIATLVMEKTAQDLEKVILTGDMDTLQLVTADVKIYSLRKGITDLFVYDIAAVKERFGLTPEQMIDYKALRGDPSDNIAGVKGIGEKTAAELLKKFGTLEEMYQQIKKGKTEGFSESVIKKLLEGEKDALFSKHLVELVKKVPIEFDLALCKVSDYNTPATRELLAKWEFGSLLKRLDGAESTTVASKKTAAGIKVKEIKTAAEVDVLNKKIASAKRLALLSVDDGQGSFKAQMFGLFFSLDNKEAFHIPASLFKKTAWPKKDATIIGHDLKRISAMLLRQGIEMSGVWHDLMVMDYLLNPGSRAHELANLVLRYLGVEVKVSAQAGLFGADIKEIGILAGYLLPLEEKISAELQDKGFLNLYQKIEAPLIPVLQKMETAGIKIDLDHLKKIAKKSQEREEKLKKEIIALAGLDFNIASPQQLKEILFDKLKIPVQGIRKGKTGLSTAASELEKMRGLHPIIDLIFDYREIVKLQNTYVDVLPGLADAQGRVHTTFNQTVTATGRLSSSDPNLQNIPIRTELGREMRRCFVAASGKKLVGADYSQIELRIIASLANDPAMIEVFERGEDIHITTAAKINGVEMSAVTKEMRQAAKAVNFGVIYGIGPQGLSEGAGISFSEAKEFIKKYFEVFKDVKKYLDETRALAHSLGYVETLLGRRRYLPDINSGMFQLRNAAERMAINAPVQGTAADLIKLAMIEIDKLIEKEYAGRAQMLLQVHDELVFEVDEKIAKEFGQAAQIAMENVIKLRVPVKVDVGVGDNWDETK